ncbi:MAG: hypothetical protein SRB2_00294 [Desulfobacteraceae bacterium Eth-SRB2]|nr:MAG: hypothetical protein SRB2_00294 [Desulfobacteraceae bacterium Eth-SRB2]
MLAAELMGELEKTLKILKKIDSFYNDFKNQDLKHIGKTTTTAIVMAEIFVDFFTCVETLFIRISRFFENSLQSEKWHSDLLHKMTLEIINIRPAVISDETFSILKELLKFRHFRRYYFDFEYDWEKIDFLEAKYNQVYKMLKRDLLKFHEFLVQIG